MGWLARWCCRLRHAVRVPAAPPVVNAGQDRRWYPTPPRCHPVYGGIRYESRLGRQWECWAIFDGALLTTETTTTIDRRHPDLMAIANQYGLTAH
jgi:hypothetical protein